MIAQCRLGTVPYEATLAAMRRYTAERDAATPDQIWLCEHPPVYTQGVAGRARHVIDPHGIPVVQSNRGGQVTYHGPGQVVAYPLVDLKRLGIFVKEYVFRIEEAVLRTLAHFDVTGHRVPGAPGIYVRLADPGSHASIMGPRREPFEGLGKIAALGIKVSRHCAYHGVALNVAMDLQPFLGIDPCGYPGLRAVDLSTIGVQATSQDVADLLGQRLASSLSP
ncbi:MAG: lipoyl(octanoyl) transferase LipB [Pseudomonadota bacterium]|nr:lipoyl(octanoyl) transferase LipB [Pseudomonadota bacterium]